MHNFLHIYWRGVSVLFVYFFSDKWEAVMFSECVVFEPFYPDRRVRREGIGVCVRTWGPSFPSSFAAYQASGYEEPQWPALPCARCSGASVLPSPGRVSPARRPGRCGGFPALIGKDRKWKVVRFFFRSIYICHMCGNMWWVRIFENVLLKHDKKWWILLETSLNFLVWAS